MVYRNLSLRARTYAGFQWVWDAPDRILVFAFCWTPEDLERTRDDFQHFATILPHEGVHKKLHLILFHSDALNVDRQTWWAGISFSPILLNPANLPLNLLPQKLDSLLGIPVGATDDEVATSAEEDEPPKPPDWRRFLNKDPDILLRKVRELAGEQPNLPEDVRPIIERLLAQVDGDPTEMEARVREILDRLWGVSG